MPSNDMKAREELFLQRERQLQAKEHALRQREQAVEAKELAVGLKEQALALEAQALAAREQAVELRERELEKQDATPSQDEVKMQSIRQKVAQEIMDTEETYVNGLLKLKTHFGVQAQAILAKEDYDIIFGSLAQALPINMALLEDLKLRLATYNETTMIGDLFIKFAPYFKLYAAYIGGHERALNLISNLCAKNKAFRTVVEKGTKIAGCTLQSCLILPVQRIPRYELLLNEMLKNTPSSHPDRPKLLLALPQLKNAAVFLDTTISEADSAAELLAVQYSLVNCPDLLRPGRTLLHRGVLSRIQKGMDTKKFELILMTDLLIFANFHRRKNDDKSSYQKHKIKGMIAIDSQFFVQSIGSSELADDRDDNDVSRTRSRSPHRSAMGSEESSRYLFRMVSGSSGQSDWACDGELEKTTWLDMLQKAAKLRQQVLDKPPNNLTGGVQLTLVSPTEEPHDITLLWLPYEPQDAVGGSLNLRVWWEELTAQVHVLLIDAQDLRTEGDTYVTLSAFSLTEPEMLAHHLGAHHPDRRGRRPKSSESDKKIPPRWSSKSRVVKKAWWGQDFTFSLTPSERTGKGRQLLRLEVWEWHQVERDVCLGQLTLDLGTIVAFPSADKAPRAYTRIPDQGNSTTTLVRSPSSRTFQPSAVKRDERFCYPLNPASSLAGVAGRFYWVTAGTCLLKHDQSFSSGQVVELIMGSNSVKHETPFSIVLRNVEDAPKKNGARQYLMQMCFRTSPALAEYWCEQLTQVMPLVRVMSRWEEKYCCRNYAPTLWQKGDHCRYCGFSRKSHEKRWGNE